MQYADLTLPETGVMEPTVQEAPDRPRGTLRAAFTHQASAASLTAALLSMGAYCLAMAAHGTYPFGRRSRAVNDLGNQFVPLHAHLRDLMHGDTTGDLYLNWSSGYGTLSVSLG